MSAFINIVAIFHAKPGQEQALAAVLGACVAPSRAEAGCVSYVLHSDRLDPARFVFIERWADQQAFDLHQKTPHFLALAAGVTDLVSGPADVMVIDALG